jgi:hypothetical protein
MTPAEITKLAFFDELQKIHAARGQSFDLEKFASAVDVDYLIKEAIFRRAARATLGGVRRAAGGVQRAGQAVSARVSPNQRFIRAVGEIDDDLAGAARTALKEQGVGARMEQYGRSMRQTPVQRVRAAGLSLKPGEAQEITELTRRMGGTSGAGRMVGGTVEGAGAHMAHAPAWKMALNPIGIPMGGAMEGATRQAGREAVAAGANLAAGGRAGVGRALGRAGTGLQRAAPVVGQVGEMATMAATHAPAAIGSPLVQAVQSATGASGFAPAFAGKMLAGGVTKGLERGGKAVAGALT